MKTIFDQDVTVVSHVGHAPDEAFKLVCNENNWMDWRSEQDSDSCQYPDMAESRVKVVAQSPRLRARRPAAMPIAATKMRSPY